MFKRIKEFFFGKAVETTVAEAPYKIEPPVTENVPKAATTATVKPTGNKKPRKPRTQAGSGKKPSGKSTAAKKPNPKSA